mgnify:CR=1 FL=1
MKPVGFKKLNEATAMGLASTFFAFRFVNLLQKPFKEWDAFALGLIDEKGESLKRASTIEEKKALDLFANLVLKIKKILQKYIPESRMLNVLIGAYLLKKEEFSDLEKELIDSLTNEEIKILNQIFVDK